MTTYSTIGILGAGNIGQAVADKVVRHGHEVLIGNSRGPETLRAVVEQLGPKAHAVTAGEAAQAELVFLAVPFFAVPDPSGLTDWTVCSTRGTCCFRTSADARVHPGRLGRSAITS